MRLMVLLLVEAAALAAVVANGIAYLQPDRNRLTRFLHGAYAGAVSNPSRRYSIFRTTRAVALFKVALGAIVALLVAVDIAAGRAR